MRSGVGCKKQPPEMSITGGQNPTNHQGGEIIGGGGTKIIRLRNRLFCAVTYINRKSTENPADYCGHGFARAST